MTALTLPDPIAAYLEADKRGPDEVARCFTLQAVVKDKGQTHVGRDAIKAWKAESSTLYTYSQEPFALEQIDDLYVVSSHVVGTFAGSPLDMKLIFRLERGLIASLKFSV